MQVKNINDGKSKSLGWLIKLNLLKYCAWLVFHIFSGLLMRVRKGITIKIGKVSEIPSNKEMTINPTNLETLPLLPILQKCKVWLIKNSFLENL